MEKKIETTIQGLGFRGFPKVGVPLKDPCNEDYSILGSELGF